jgi:hypothetical protein
MKNSIYFIMIALLLFSCDQSKNTNTKQTETIIIESELQTNTAKNQSKLETYYSKQHWGDNRMSFNKYLLTSKLVGKETIIEFIDSINFKCHIYEPTPGCGMGSIVYDTMQWNKNNNIIRLSISGVQIGMSAFKNYYEYQYYQVDKNKFDLHF